MTTPKPIDVSRYSRIVFLTGAGISAASGLPTFRGLGSKPKKDTEWLSHAANLPESLPGLWKIYGDLRRRAPKAEPNAAHVAIAELQKRWGDSRSIVLATQNVDGLHLRAGSEDVVELHGAIRRSRCMNPECPSTPHEDMEAPEDDSVPPCPQCGSALRPDIVLFGEPLPVDAQWTMKQALRDCDLFIAVGTSGTVSPASDYVRNAEYAGARTILVNLTPMAPPNPYFKEEYLGPSEELLPILLGV